MIDRVNQTKEITSTHDHVLNVPHLREQDEYKALNRTDASMLLVLTGFPQELSDRICQVAIVTHLFNESAFNPTSWKTAQATPVSKGDKK